MLFSIGCAFFILILSGCKGTDGYGYYALDIDFLKNGDDCPDAGLLENSNNNFDINLFEVSPPLLINPELIDVELLLTGVFKGSTEVSGVIVNNAAHQILFSPAFEFELLYEDNWYKVPRHEVVWFAGARLLPSGEEGWSPRYSLSSFHPFPSAELYRIRTRISIFSEKYYYNSGHDIVMEFTWDDLAINLIPSPPLLINPQLVDVELLLTSINKEDMVANGVIINNTPHQIIFGSRFEFEFLYDGSWYKAPLYEEMWFTLGAIILSSGAESPLPYSLSPFYPFPGTELYRIRKQIGMFSYSEEYHCYSLHDLIMEFAWE